MAKRSAFINSIAVKTMRSRVTGRRSARKDPLIFQRDTASRLALRLTMRRIATTLAVVGAFLFSAGATLADDTSEANKLFVEAMQLSLSAEDEESLEKKAAALEASLAKLNEIFDEYPSTELAVKLISGQSVGGISLESYGEEMSHWEKYERAKEDVPILDEAITSLGLDKLL